MREIKFRAWSNKFNRMFRVNELSQDRDGYTHGTVDVGFEDEHHPTQEEFNKHPKLAFMGRVDFTKASDGRVAGLWQNPGDEPFYLMRYTGLKDKNGMEIYEGDILNYKSSLGMTEKLLVVTWSEPDAMFEFGGIRVDYASRNGEVIGNIHEHPHLLETQS